MLDIQGADWPEAKYWDQVVSETLSNAPIPAWRAYMQWVYRGLIHRWFADVYSGRTLKTDLFEEAITSCHLLPDLGPGSVGIDHSSSVVQAASERLQSEGHTHRLVVGDLRRIPFRAGSMQRVFSGSSLDHFREKEDIAVSLKELVRVLADGGTLVVVFDNPHNPVVWLRNRLPMTLLSRLRLAPYYMGPTYNRAEIRDRLGILGMQVTNSTALAHVPRAPAIWLAALLDNVGAAALRPMLLRILVAFEVMERWPIRYWTGYYLAIRAEKPIPAPMERK